MGSLVPGWDAPMGVPKELVEHEDVPQEPQGYFAKLEKVRSTRTTHEEVGIPSLSRISAPLSGVPLATAPSLKKTSMGHTPSMGSHDRKSLDHAASHGKYQMTDWAEELNSLRPKKDFTRASAEPKASTHHGWWQQMDASAINVNDQTAILEDRNATRGSFVPQYGVTGQGVNFTLHSTPQQPASA